MGIEICTLFTERECESAGGGCCIELRLRGFNADSWPQSVYCHVVQCGERFVTRNVCLHCCNLSLPTLQRSQVGGVECVGPIATAICCDRDGAGLLPTAQHQLHAGQCFGGARDGAADFTSVDDVIRRDKVDHRSRSGRVDCKSQRACVGHVACSIGLTHLHGMGTVGAGTFELIAAACEPCAAVVGAVLPRGVGFQACNADKGDGSFKIGAVASVFQQSKRRRCSAQVRQHFARRVGCGAQGCAVGTCNGNADVVGLAIRQCIGSQGEAPSTG